MLAIDGHFPRECADADSLTAFAIERIRTGIGEVRAG
jgi:hypothetical protein